MAALVESDNECMSSGGCNGTETLCTRRPEGEGSSVYYACL